MTTNRMNANMGSHSVRIDRPGIAQPEVVASGLSANRAHDLAMNVRRTLKPGERLYVESSAGFTVIGECK